MYKKWVPPFVKKLLFSETKHASWILKVQNIMSNAYQMMLLAQNLFPPQLWSFSLEKVESFATWEKIGKFEIERIFSQKKDFNLLKKISENFRRR